MKAVRYAQKFQYQRNIARNLNNGLFLPMSTNKPLPMEDIPLNLFDILPFRNQDLGDKEEEKPYVLMTYLPDGTYH